MIKSGGVLIDAARAQLRNRHYQAHTTWPLNRPGGPSATRDLEGGICPLGDARAGVRSQRTLCSGTQSALQQGRANWREDRRLIYQLDQVGVTTTATLGIPTAV